MSVTVQCIAISLANAGLGYDIALIGGLLANRQWLDDFSIPPGGAILGTVIASFVFGAVAAAIPSAILSDYIGRRRSVMIACILNIAGVIGQCLASGWRALVITRSLSGFGTGISLTNSAAYLNELVNVRRAQVTALSQTTFSIGAIPAAWCAFGGLYIQGHWSWRIVLLCQAPWPLLQLILIIVCPESPRWLMMKGRVEDARKLIDEELITKLAAKHDGRWASFLKHPRIVLLLVLLAFATQWTGSGVIQYYLPQVLDLAGITDSVQQSGLNAGIQCFNLIIAVIGASQVEHFGRRTLLIGSAIGMLGFVIILTACSAAYVYTGSRIAAIMAIISIFGYFGSYNIGFTPVPALYITELVPTELRAKTSAVFAGLVGAVICMVQWVNPVALAALGWKYYLVFMAANIPTIILLWMFAPETKGKDLEQAATTA